VVGGPPGRLRAGDDAKVEKITVLLQSVKRIMAEAKLKA
jgi:hypothetical protein